MQSNDLLEPTPVSVFRLPQRIMVLVHMKIYERKMFVLFLDLNQLLRRRSEVASGRLKPERHLCTFIAKLKSTHH